MAWQDLLLVIVTGVTALVVLGLVLLFAVRRIQADRQQLRVLNDVVLELHTFMGDLTKEVGHDGGTALAERLKQISVTMEQLGKTAEVARVLTAQAQLATDTALLVAKDSRTRLEVLIHDLAQTVERAREMQQEGQRYLELLTRVQAKDIILNQTQTAADISRAVGGIHQSGGEFTTARDAVGGNESVGGNSNTAPAATTKPLQLEVPPEGISVAIKGKLKTEKE